MEELVINGVPISFPFKPYDVQIAYMEKVIECLQKRQNGVLESPTGTGKTLSLLCASCGWLTTKKAQLQAEVLKLSDGDFVSGLQDRLSAAAGITASGSGNGSGFGFRVPKIIYASRTHAQLSQAIQELKRTCYSHMRVSVLGSREQMCIHPEVSRETSNAAKVMMCRLKVRSKTCHYHNNLESKKDAIISEQTILDIEDLVKVGKKKDCCPYYLSREIKKDADIIFMPYNYLLDLRTRKAHGIEVENCVIILDEAHNIEKMCEESASIEFSSTDIALCIDEITQAMKEFVKDDQSGSDFSYESSQSVPKDFTPEDLCILKTIFLELEKAVDNIPLGSDGVTFAGDYMFDLLAKADLTQGKMRIVLELLDKIVQYLSTTSTSPFQRKGSGLQKFSELMTIVFGNNRQTLEHIKLLKRCYKVHISMEIPKNKKQKSDIWSVSKPVSSSSGRIINYWCFSSKFSMESLGAQGVHCIVLTSGTLAPLKPLISELGIPVSVLLENQHIVGPSQVCVAIIRNGPDGCQLNSSYNTRNDPRYISSLARTIINFSRIIPDGLLVFFPSYHMMKKCQDDWQQEGLWSNIANIKPIFVEPRNKEEFTATMEGYYSNIEDPSTRGACFMAVTRGKVSEGLDFADCNGRAVIITGLPYPPFKDPRIELKRSYLDEVRTKENEYLSGHEWYQLEATRAVNQAVGRVIRHAKDYGVILLCDCRFDQPHIKKQMSSWLQPHIKTYSEFGVVMRHIREFFRNAEKLLPSPKPRSLSDYRLAPVAAQFDTSISRNKSHSSQATMSSVTNIYSECSPQDYLSAPSWKPSEDGSVEKPQGLFDLLDKPTSVIDFNNSLYPKTGDQNKTVFSSEPPSNEPNTKRRKLKIVPLKFGPLSSKENGDEDESVNYGASTSRNLSSFQKVSSRVCLSDLPDSRTLSRATQENSGGSGNHPMGVKKKDPSQTAGIATYVKEVKKKLSPVLYQKFIAVTQQYNKESNYKHLVEELEKIFCSSEELFHLFSGFHSFVKSHHKNDFSSHCQRLSSNKSGR